MTTDLSPRQPEIGAPVLSVNPDPSKPQHYPDDGPPKRPPGTSPAGAPRQTPATQPNPEQQEPHPNDDDGGSDGRPGSNQ